MYKHIFILLALLSCFQVGISQNLTELKQMTLNETTFKQWNKYIYDYAPADSALDLVNHFARIHLFGNRPAVAYQVYDMYSGLFPAKQDKIKLLLDICLNRAISMKANQQTFAQYHNIIVKNAPSEEAFVAVQKIAAYYLDLKSFDSAAVIFKAYKTYFPLMNNRFDSIVNLLERDEKQLEITNLGSPLNTAANEWDPNPTPDGKRLFFSSDREGTIGGADIWFADCDSFGYSEPMRLGHGVNGKNKETIDNVIFDGSGLTLSGNFDGTFGKYDIYTFMADTSGKFSLKHLPYPINTEYTDESANITADGRALLFCSDRKGGIGDFHKMDENFHGNAMGNTDLYVSLKIGETWSEPINLGQTINTPYAERTPYLHPDGKTLYFSSDGHYGLGGLDVFVSRRLSDTSWTDWSEPVNLGRFVNSSGDDWGYKISLDSKTAFFSIAELPGGIGGWDIYKIEMPEIAKSSPIAVISGSVRDAESDLPLSAVIKYEDLSDGKLLGEIISNPATGAYMIALPAGKNYGIFVEKHGYVPKSIDINLIDSLSRDLTYDFSLQAVATAAKNKTEITLENIYFDYDKSSLKKESVPALKRFVEFLQKEDKYDILIEGHTDELGSEEYNLQLSKKRADEVFRFLKNAGINPERITTKAYGETKPLSNQKSDLSKNRRVSFRLILR